MLFDQLGLSPGILQAVSEQGYREPTPIQAQAIPVILAGRDVMGGAQTGTGKTASFVLPMLQKLAIHANNSTSPAKHPIRAVILTPTRELAMQVHDSVKTYGKYLPLRSTVVYGGVNIESQILAVRNGIEILVATPGRLLDHVQQKTLLLSKVEILVLDEADRMLDMGFLPDLKQIIQLLPSQRQNLMFSATFSDEIKKLANKILIDPVLIEVAKRNSISDLISHVVYPVEPLRKQSALIQLMKQQNIQQLLVFTRTKLSADRLAHFLKRQNISCAAIHGDRNQSQRTEALESFKQNAIQVLVATDVAARGLDIEELTHVVNFELPNNPEDYVHRIGRTGRAGAKGYAISLVGKNENGSLVSIEKLLGIKIKVEELNGVALNKQRGELAKKNVLAEESNNKTRFARESKRLNQPLGRHHEGNQGAIAKNPTAFKANKNEDPLFTQPYISKYPDIASIAAATELSRKNINKRFSNRAVPALFTAINKQK